MHRLRELLYVEPRMPAWWDRSIIALSIVAVGLILVDLELSATSELSQALAWVDLGLCVVFVSDFCWRCKRSRQRWRFLWRNWIDLLGSIPFWGPLRAARVVRLVRLLRLLRVAVLIRRVFERRGWTVPPTIRYIGYVAVAVWIAAAVLFWAFERDANENLHSLDDALWWSITTLSTVGYGDLYPKTLGGRGVALVTMVLGVGILGMLAGSLATELIDSRNSSRRGTGKYAMKNHLVILGWNAAASGMITELSLDPRYVNLRIVIVADLEQAPYEDRHVKFVRGSPVQRTVLLRAGADHAAAAVVLAVDPTDAGSDMHTALAVSAMRHINPSSRITAELVASENANVVQEQGCDELVHVTGLACTLLARSVQDLGTVALIDDMLSNGGGAQLYRVPVTQKWEGKTVREYGAWLLDQRRSLVALQREGCSEPLPDPNLELRGSDDVFIICHERPDATS